MGLVIEKRLFKLGQIRFANHDDVDAIERLVDVECNNVFQQADLHRLIELSVLNLCQLNTAGEVTGFISLNGYPNIACLHSGAWEEHIWKHFKLTDMRAQNTFFVHMFCWHTQYSRKIVKKMLKSVYLYNTYIDYIAIVMPPGSSKTIQVGYNMEMIFDRTMEFKRGVKSTDLQFLYVAERSKINPRLRIRKAVEEDNDDLVPIIDRQSARLNQLYGDFYISELIARHPESDRVLLVAEVAEVAVGVMCLNTIINYDLLNETFHLEIFWGLRKQSKAEAKHQEAQFQKESSKLNEDKDQEEYISKCHINLNEESVSYDRLSTVTNICATYEDIGAEQYRSNYKKLWNTILKEDEAFDYHIANIDKKLLEVPSFLSYEKFIESCKYDYGAKKSLDLQLNTVSVSEEEEILEPHDEKDIPKYSGKPNAFVIELFAIHEKFDERYGFDILEVAFEIFPDLDYCILALPTSHTVYPLLEHFTLVSPRVCRCKCVSQALYVAHRNSVCGKINVRCGELADLKKATQLLSRLSITSEELTEIFTSSIEQPFVIETESEPVGIAVVSPTETPIFNRNRYCLNNLRNMRYIQGEGVQAGQGTLQIMVISPVVQPHANFFLREIFRLSGLTGLYWLCEPKDVGPLDRDVMSLFGEMIRVLPRRCIQYQPEIVKTSKILKKIERNVAPFCMWYTSPRLTSLPKIDVNHSIVVVGASRTGIAFIETLIFGASSSYVNFTNITLISERGLLPYDESCSLGAILMKPITFVRSVGSKFTDRYVKSIPIQYLIDSITETMVEINRIEKYILFSNGSRKYYDQLFLMCGTQYQHPEYLRELLAAETGSNESSPQNCLHTLMDDPKRKEISFATKFFTPENFFIINTVYDANTALKYLRKNIKNRSDYNVVVYGASIQAYCCLNGLLTDGIPAARIIFVESFPSSRSENHQVSFFNNEYVDEVVNKRIEELGIRVYRRYYLARDEKEWCTYSNNILKTVKFISHEKFMELECIAFFYFGVRGININTFIALNKCGIVYDGGVVIDENFATNDTNIYCAGTMTKYRRMYYLDMQKQMYYHYQDVGHALAEIVRKQLDPFMNSGITTTKQLGASLISIDPKEKIFKLPKFQSPVIVETMLPGGLYYLKLREPGQEIPLEVFIPQERYGHVYETNKSGYFRLHFNSKNKVCGITCISKKLFNSKNLLTLYGRHEQLLNNFMARFAANQIDDLFVYFNQTWMHALYHDNFNQVLHRINVLPPVVEGFAETLRDVIENTLVFTNKPGLAIEESKKACTFKYKDLSYGEQVIAELVGWLSDSPETLPFYAIPELMSYVCAQVHIALASQE